MERICLVAIAVVGCGRSNFDPPDGRLDAIDGDSGLPAGLVARYLMDDDVADGALDTSGMGHVGTCYTSCPTLVPGRVATGYAFDGVSDLIVVSHTAALAPSNGLTATAWLRIATAPSSTGGSIWAKPVGGGFRNTWALDVRQDLSLYVCIGDAFTGTCMRSSPGAVTLAQWQHVALTYDGSTMQVWVGATAVVTAAAVTFDYDTNPILIGGDLDSGSPGYLLRGTLDDVRIWNRALGEQEIIAIAAP